MDDATPAHVIRKETWVDKISIKVAIWTVKFKKKLKRGGEKGVCTANTFEKKRHKSEKRKAGIPGN